MKKFLFLLLIACTASGSYAQSVDFKLNLPLNKPYKMVTVMKMDMDGAQSLIMDMNTKSTTTFTKKEDRNYTQESVTDAVKMDMDAGMMTMSYDSENPTDDPMSKILAGEMDKIVGSKITVVMNDKGQIITTDGEEDDQSSPNPLGNMTMTATFPDHPIKPGDTWESEVDLKDQMTVKSTNKFVSKTAEGYLIESVGELFSKEKESIGNLTSKSILNTKTFMTHSATVNMEMMVQGQSIKLDLQVNIED
ncbi:MAG: DUF6263 family protein [Sphingobacterium sp.]